jgi:hypothetical protein
VEASLVVEKEATPMHRNTCNVFHRLFYVFHSLLPGTPTSIMRQILGRACFRQDFNKES